MANTDNTQVPANASMPVERPLTVIFSGQHSLANVEHLGDTDAPLCPVSPVRLEVRRYDRGYSRFSPEDYAAKGRK